MNHDGSIPTTASCSAIATMTTTTTTMTNEATATALVLEVATASLPPVAAELEQEKVLVAATDKKKSFLSSLFPFKTKSKEILPPDDLLSRHQVCISYGALTNLETLLNYGFVRRGNPCNTERLLVPLLGLPTPIVADCDARGKIDPLALGALRRAVATTEELTLAPSNPRLETFSMVPYLSVRNEEEVHAVLAGYLEEALHEAKQGSAAAAARGGGDALVCDYLHGRAETLERTLDRIRTKFPQVFG